MKKILCFAVAMILLLGLAGCDNSPKYEAFYFYEMDDDGVLYSAEDVQKDLDMEGKNLKLNDIFYLYLYPDGTAVLCSMGVVSDMRYNDTEIWSVTDASIRAKFTRNGDTVILEEDNARLTYKKG